MGAFFISLRSVTQAARLGPSCMKLAILPHHRFGRIRLLALMVVFGVLASAFRIDRLVRALAYEKREGDILFQSLPSGDLVRAIEGITDSPWSHCGILIRQGDSWFVIEALGTVRETPYWLWLIRSRGAQFSAYRVMDVTPAEIGRVASAARRFLGRPYDFRYAPGDDELYCSELVHRAFEDGCGIRLGSWDRLGDLQWKPFEAFIREMEAGPLPLDRRMITPVGLTRSTRMLPVYPDGQRPPSIASVLPE